MVTNATVLSLEVQTNALSHLTNVNKDISALVVESTTVVLVMFAQLELLSGFLAHQDTIVQMPTSTVSFLLTLQSVIKAITAVEEPRLLEVSLMIQLVLRLSVVQVISVLQDLLIQSHVLLEHITPLQLLICQLTVLSVLSILLLKFVLREDLLHQVLDLSLVLLVTIAKIKVQPLSVHPVHTAQLTQRPSLPALKESISQILDKRNVLNARRAIFVMMTQVLQTTEQIMPLLAQKDTTVQEEHMN